METWFEWFDNLPVTAKADIKWPFTLDFEVQGKFIVDDLRALLEKKEAAADEELLAISQHCFNLLSWIRQMGIMGFLSLGGAVDDLLIKEFGHASVIEDLQKDSFDMWQKGKEGQFKIGENYFSIYQGIIYSRNLRGDWSSVAAKDVFSIMPVLGEKTSSEIVERLEEDYRPTPYDQIYEAWRNSGFGSALPEGLFVYQNGETTPEDNLQITLGKIRAIIANPVAYAYLESLHTKGEDYLAYMIKLGYLMLQFVTQRRESGEHTVYLLRDCVIFQELQKTLDFLEGNETSCDHLLIGRKVLSNAKREGGHWYVTQEILFHAYHRHPNDFSAFYEDYSRMIREYTDYSPDFQAIVQELAVYITKHIQNAIDNRLKITVVDLGFQGSINIFVKYIIDNYCLNNVKLETDIHMYVLAEWFKTVYGHKFTSETYSMLTHVEVLARNEYLYDYKKESFGDGGLTVTMGKESDQRDADIELLALTMTAVIAKQLKLI